MLHSLSHQLRQSILINLRFLLTVDFSSEVSGAMPDMFGEDLEAVWHKSVHNNKMIAFSRAERQQLLL